MSICRVVSSVVAKGCLLWPVRSLYKALLNVALLHFVLQGKTWLSFWISFDFLLLHSNLLWWKGHLLLVLVLEGIVGLHRIGHIIWCMLKKKKKTLVIMKMSTNNKYWQLWRKGTLLYCLWKYKFVKPLWRFLKTLKMKLPYDPEIPLLGIHPDKTILWKDTCTLMFISTITISKTWKQPKHLPTDEWIKKLWYILLKIYYGW